jgi:hypothetical protein
VFLRQAAERQPTVSLRTDSEAGHRRLGDRVIGEVRIKIADHPIGDHPMKLPITRSAITR